MTISRRCLIAGSLGVALLPLRVRAIPDPEALAYAWVIEAAPHVLPVLCGAGPEWIGAVRAACETWNQAQPWFRLDVQETEIPGGAVNTAAGTISVVAPWREASWVGITDCRYDGTRIVAATVSFDDADYRNREPWPESSAREWIAAHELGHALGLPHAPAGDGGCMEAGSAGWPAAAPSAWTLRELDLTYGEPQPTEDPLSKRKKRHKRRGRRR